jgi:hypothetical protein
MISRNLDNCVWIQHPGDLRDVMIVASYQEAMKKWFEGYNLPIVVENGRIETFSESHDRVTKYYN